MYEEDLDHIVGILYAKDLVRWLGEKDPSFTLRPLLRRPIVVPETKQVADLLADFQRSEVHMAMVVDEYGGTAGLVTIEDVLEEIVGEIVDEHEPDDEERPDCDRCRTAVSRSTATSTSTTSTRRSNSDCPRTRSTTPSEDG